MNLQDFAVAAKGRVERRERLVAGELLRVGPWPGELRVIDGRVWLTRTGDPDDHVLQPGDRLLLERGRDALVESWDPAEGATVQWVPQPRPRVFAALAAAALDRLAVWSGDLARGLEGFRARLDAAARNAASSASRAQGRICSAESMACGGTVQ